MAPKRSRFCKDGSLDMRFSINKQLVASGAWSGKYTPSPYYYGYQSYSSYSPFSSGSACHSSHNSGNSYSTIFDSQSLGKKPSKPPVSSSKLNNKRANETLPIFEDDDLPRCKDGSLDMRFKVNKAAIASGRWLNKYTKAPVNKYTKETIDSNQMNQVEKREAKQDEPKPLGKNYVLRDKKILYSVLKDGSIDVIRESPAVLSGFLKLNEQNEVIEDCDAVSESVIKIDPMSRRIEIDPNYGYNVSPDDRMHIPIIIMHKIDYVLGLKFDLNLYNDIKSLMNFNIKANNCSQALLNYRTVINYFPADLLTSEEKNYTSNFPFFTKTIIQEEVAIVEPNEDEEEVVIANDEDDEEAEEIANASNDMMNLINAAAHDEEDENINENIEEAPSLETNEHVDSITATEVQMYNFGSPVTNGVVCHEESKLQST